MSALTVWFLFVFVPNIGFLAVLVFLGLTVWTIISNIHRVMEDYDIEEEKYKKVTRLNYRMSVVLSVLLLIAASAPSKKEMAAVVLIPYISNNAEMQKIPENLAKKLNEYLTDQIAPKKEKDNEE